MAALTVSAALPNESVRYDFRGALIAGWQAFRQRRRERRTLVAISRLGPRVIRDIGLDPEQIYTALDGSWDEIDPRSFGGMLPRRRRS